MTNAALYGFGGAFSGGLIAFLATKNMVGVGRVAVIVGGIGVLGYAGYYYGNTIDNTPAPIPVIVKGADSNGYLPIYDKNTTSTAVENSAPTSTAITAETESVKRGV